jgi:hypothetical protein
MNWEHELVIRITHRCFGDATNLMSMYAKYSGKLVENSLPRSSEC